MDSERGGLPEHTTVYHAQPLTHPACSDNYSGFELSDELQIRIAKHVEYFERPSALCSLAGRFLCCQGGARRAAPRCAGMLLPAPPPLFATWARLALHLGVGKRIWRT